MAQTRVMTEPAARELAAQLMAYASGAGAAASFLAAYPAGSVYRTTDPVSPAARFGGAWESLPSLECYAWLRVDDGDDGTAQQFLQAHPVGCVYEECSGVSPARFGGTWEAAPGLGAHRWIRTA